MALTILGGFAKGMSIKVPPGDLIRPMSVMLKRKIFDANQNLEDHHFIDLCAGSGAVGLEATSRGASPVEFCERSKKVQSFTKSNITQFQSKYDSEIKLHSTDCLKWLKAWKTTYENFNEDHKSNVILFFAPPYPLHQMYRDFAKIINQGWFRGQIWLESDRQKGLKQEDIIKDLGEPKKLYKQGTTFLLVYDKNE